MANSNLPLKIGTRTQAAKRSLAAERRGAERVSLTLAAELIEIPDGARITGRMSDCCMFGCFVDSINTFPDRTTVRLRLRKGHEMFEAEAVVAYSQFQLGMGVAFTYVSQQNRRVLESWMARGMGHSTHEMTASVLLPEQLAETDPSKQFEKLIRLLLEKGVLREADAREFLGRYVL